MRQLRVSEVRTQIYLPQPVHQKIRDIAKKQHISIAQVLREAIAQKYLPNELEEVVSMRRYR